MTRKSHSREFKVLKLLIRSTFAEHSYEDKKKKKTRRMNLPASNTLVQLMFLFIKLVYRPRR